MKNFWKVNQIFICLNSDIWVMQATDAGHYLVLHSEPLLFTTCAQWKQLIWSLLAFNQRQVSLERTIPYTGTVRISKTSIHWKCKPKGPEWQQNNNSLQAYFVLKLLKRSFKTLKSQSLLNNNLKKKKHIHLIIYYICAFYLLYLFF